MIEINDFVQLEYKKAMLIIERLHAQKLSYQRLFISLVTGIGAVSIALLNFEADDKIVGFNTSNLVGFLLIITSVVGLSMIRNLAAIRKGEVFYTKISLIVRNYIIDQLRLPDTYPRIAIPSAKDRYSSDYITIFMCSLTNLTMFCSGIWFFIEVSNPLAVVLILLFFLVVYVNAHYRLIEKYLNRAFEPYEERK